MTPLNGGVYQLNSDRPNPFLLKNKYKFKFRITQKKRPNIDLRGIKKEGVYGDR